MTKPLSEQFANLSTRAKKAEDAVAAAKQDGAAKAQQRQDQIKADMTQRKASAEQHVTEAKDSVSSAWTGMTTMVQSDVNSLRTKIDYKKYQVDRNRAARAADDAEENAEYAAEFAIDAIDYAEAAALDALLARAAANAM